MAHETILVSVEDKVGIVQIHRPNVMNAINRRVMTDFTDALAHFERNEKIKAIVITGGLRMFAAGGDINELRDLQPFQAWDFADLAHHTIRLIEECPKPTITAITGFALDGGLEMAMATDIRIAAENAVFGFPEINAGIHPGGTGTQRLPHLVGLGRAKEIILTGDFFDARKAFEIGLIHMVVPANEVIEAAVKLGRTLARKPPLALKLAKEALNTSMNTGIKSGSRLEQEGFAMLFSSEDQRIGMDAFLTGRRAEFTGR